MPINSFSVIKAAEIETLASQLSGDQLYQLVKKIDNIIKFKASQSEFQCDIIVSAFTQYQKVPQEVYTLTQIYQARGFNTLYDGNLDVVAGTSSGDVIVISPQGSEITVAPQVGRMTIKWHSPRMTFQDLLETPNPNVIRIPDLGYNFFAHTLYLCETGGVDLRQFSEDWVLRQIDVLLKKAAIDGLSYVNYTGPNGLFQKVPTNSLTTLYSSVIDQLTAAGYNASFVNGILAITWVLDPNAPALPEPGDGTADPVSDADLTYTYTQAVPSAQWIIHHDLGKYVSVTIVDDNNNQIVGSVTYIDENTVQIDFSVPVTGKAYLN